MTEEDDARTAALRKIAAFDIDTATIAIQHGEYVPVGHLRYLRELARKALGLPLIDSGTTP
jgi:hypothetical protein